MSPSTSPAQAIPSRAAMPLPERQVDVPGMLRQASTPVKVDHLLRSGKRDIHLISRDRIAELFRRAIASIVEKCRAAGAAADPAMLARLEADSKEELDDLVGQQRSTEQASEEFAFSQRALRAELGRMRADLAEQRAFADGRLPEEVERAMVEKRFETLSRHLEAMERALGSLFSSRLYSFRQIEKLRRDAVEARKRSEAKAKAAAFLAARAPAAVRAPGGPIAAPADVREDPPAGEIECESGRGLDVGTVNLRAASRRMDGSGTAYRTRRNAFLEVRDGDVGRKMLKYGIDYVVRGEKGYFLGDSACEFAALFGKDVRRPMREGLFSPEEPDAVLIVNHMVEELLGPPREAGEICTFAVPGDPLDDGRNFIYPRSSLEAAIANMGYTPRPMLESHLVALAELKEQDYTGLALSCGGGMVNVCVVFKSVPTLAFSTARGGDWIDAGVAAALGLSVPFVTAVKEGGMHLLKPKGRVEEAIAIYHRNLIQYTLEGMMRRLSEAEHRPSFAMPVHLVLAGGTAVIPGFVDLFREEFERAEFPIEVAQIRLSRNPLHGVAEGCLESALAESRAAGGAASEVAPAALTRAAVCGVPKADPTTTLLLERLREASSRGEGAVLRT
jgi:hypothetical protein